METKLFEVMAKVVIISYLATLYTRYVTKYTCKYCHKCHEIRLYRLKMSSETFFSRFLLQNAGNFINSFPVYNLSNLNWIFFSVRCGDCLFKSWPHHKPLDLAYTFVNLGIDSFMVFVYDTLQVFLANFIFDIRNYLTWNLCVVLFSSAISGQICQLQQYSQAWIHCYLHRPYFGWALFLYPWLQYYSMSQFKRKFLHVIFISTWYCIEYSFHKKNTL